MTISHLLEDFSAGVEDGDLITMMSDVALEDQRLASFEKGYSAGWEDAFEAQEKDQTKAAGRLSDCLGDLSFTYHEALAQLLSSVEPVFRSLVELVLPDIMVRSFGHHIVEQLCDLAGDQVSGPAHLVVPVGVGAALSPLLKQESAMPVRVVEDKNLEPGRAYIRLGSVERELDGTALLESIRNSIDAFTYEAKKEVLHG